MLPRGWEDLAQRTPEPERAVGGWHELAERELERAACCREPLGLLLLDLDRFKQVDDTHGHLAGDAVLQAVARALREKIRSHDLVEVIGRWGGEEFAALLPNTRAADAVRIAERLRARVAALHTLHPDQPDTTIAVTVSVGWPPTLTPPTTSPRCSPSPTPPSTGPRTPAATKSPPPPPPPCRHHRTGQRSALGRVS